jgi:hypothetical protein
MNFLSLIATINDIILATTAPVTAYIAWREIRKWKEELNGKASFEVSRDLLKATYRVRDAIKKFLYPLSIHELPSDYLASGKSISKLTTETLHYIYKNRWDKVCNTTIEFNVQVFEAEAIWTQSIRDKCDKLMSITSELLELANEDIESSLKDGYLEVDKSKFYTKLNIYTFESKHHQFNEKVSLAINEIEKEIKQYLPSPPKVK